MYEGIIQRIFRDAKELPVLLPEKYALEAGTRSGDFFSVFFSAASFSPVPVHLLIFYISFSLAREKQFRSGSTVCFLNLRILLSPSFSVFFPERNKAVMTRLRTEREAGTAGKGKD